MATKATAFRADRPSLSLHKYTKEDPNQKAHKDERTAQETVK